MAIENNFSVAKRLLGKNYIGLDKLSKIQSNFNFVLPKVEPKINFDLASMNIDYNDHILILGVDNLHGTNKLNIIELIKIFGYEKNNQNPVFYNQDWYIKHKFMYQSLDFKWYLIKKNVYPDSKAILPDFTPYKNLPSAILCTYTFFVYFLLNNEILWESNFVWCSDYDDNGDRIYVGKYNDITGLNNNGFSIHRHLTIRDHFGVIDFKQ
jgi:hypothetical protein